MKISRQRAYQLRHRAKGLFIKCVTEAIPGSPYCVYHLAQAREYQHKKIECERKNNCLSRTLEIKGGVKMEPIYVFFCGHKVLLKNLRKNKNKTITCPDCGMALKNRIVECIECGIRIEASIRGYMPEYCKSCLDKRKLQSAKDYYNAKRTGTLKEFKEKRGYNFKRYEKPKKDITLKPNPIIINPDRAPCGQGPCRYFKDSRDSVICEKCEEREKFIIRQNLTTLPTVRHNWAVRL